MVETVGQGLGEAAKRSDGRSARRWYRRPGGWVLFAVVLLGVAVRLALDPVAAHYTRKALDEMPGYQGSFAGVHVTLLPPGYEVRRIKLTEELRGGPARQPVLYAERAQVRLLGRELLHGRIVARIRIDEPKITVIRRLHAAEKKKKAAAPPPGLADQLEKQRPMRVDRIEVRGGELVYRDLTEKHRPAIWLHDLEVTVENIATRPALGGGKPVTISVGGKVAKSGALTAFVSLDPWAKGLTFAGRTELRGLRTAELYDFIEAKTNLQAPQGTIDLFAEFVVKDGVIKGGVKPVLKNVSIKPADGDLGSRLEAWVADKSLDVASDRVPGRNAVATTIPIHGKITDPQAEILPAVLGVIRNAFVVGVSSGFRQLLAPAADKEEGVLTQARHALDKDKGPPKAQPERSARKPKRSR
jgi:hypothetical protein